jgi:hypothetical protein
LKVRVAPAVTTHKVPLGLFIGMILARNKKALLLGIQPGSVEWMGRMSDEVE